MPWLASAIAQSRAPTSVVRMLGMLLALAFGCAASGCSTGGQSFASFTQAGFTQGGGGATLAFESIDGPPPQVFDRLVNALNIESQGKPIAIVSRDAPAA